VGLCVIALSGSAHAVTINFTRLTNNAGAVNPASQFRCELTDIGGGQIQFRFTNNVGIASSITDVYFDDGTLLGIASIASSNGVDFTQGASPGNLPGGNAVGFETTAGFSLDSTSPVPINGINRNNEWLRIRFNLINGKTFADTVAALGTDLRIGLHVQAITDEGWSDSFISNNGGVTFIPLPTAGAMGLAGLAGLALVRRRRPT